MFADPRTVSPAIRALSPDFMDWPFLGGIIGQLPERFKPAVIESYSGKRQAQGQQAANLWMLDIGERVTERAANLAASDAEICETAARLAKEAAGMLADSVPTTPEAIRAKLAKLCDRHGIAAPDAETLAGFIARLVDAAWWRRQLRRTVAREIERQAIGIGLVHKRAGVYASDETCSRHAEQLRRNAAALEATEAENEEGQVMTLAELAEKGISNPNIRRAELMTRIRGFEDWAKEAGHVGLFYTWTCPSRMHARLSKSGQENPKYDGTTPKEAAGFLAKQWAKARAWLNRRGLFPYGFRVAEPHHDGTPHWHLLLFIAADVAETLTACIRRYAYEPDAHELTSAAALDARFKVVTIDWERGSAAGYIAKYICKNIDGKKTTGESIGDDFDAGGDAIEGAARVRAWASCWGIRQFQQIGGPGVTIWRELRRIREDEDKPVQGELFPLWGCADKGVWHGYIREMGGIEIARRNRTLQVWRETPAESIDCHGVIHAAVNKYNEPAAPVIKGVCLNRPTPGQSLFKTRVHQWTIRRAAPKAAPVKARPKAAQPWTRVNNCTQGRAGFGAALEHAYSIGPDLAREVFAALVAVKKTQTGRVFRPVSLEEIQKCKSGTS